MKIKHLDTISNHGCIITGNGSKFYCDIVTEEARKVLEESRVNINIEADESEFLPRTPLHTVYSITLPINSRYTHGTTNNTSLLILPNGEILEVIVSVDNPVTVTVTEFKRQ